MNIYNGILIGCACLTLHSQLFSQSHDSDGYYINFKGDTVFGKFINYQEPAASPSVFSFQATGSSEAISLSPDKSKKVSVNRSDNYIAYQGKRQTNPTNYNDAQLSDTGDVYEDISAFLRELYNDGHYHLYELVDKRRSNFFVSQDAGALRELSYKEFLNNGNVVEWPGFRLQLEDLFRPVLQSKPERQRLIDKVAYNGPRLTDLFSKMSTGKKVVQAKGKYPAKLFIGLGASANSLKIGPGSNDYLEKPIEGDYPAQTTPLFETGIKLFSQRNYGRLFYMFKADFYHFRFAHASFDSPSFTNFLVTFKANVLSIPLSIGYKLINNRDLSIDLSAGAALNLLLQYSETLVASAPGAVDTYLLSSKSETFSLFGEAAFVLFNKFSVFGGYYLPASITEPGDVQANHSSVRFGARYYIF
jgi:hypothetical protein